MMIGDRIDFISAYCDRWCERCAFTDRCSSYACSVAIAMCGDVKAGIELAVGRPQPVGSEKEKPVGDRIMEELETAMPSEAELDAVGRELDARHERISREPLTDMADTYMQIATVWLNDHADVPRSDAPVCDALEIIRWDVYLIGAKLRRALDGRDRSRHGEEDWDDDPVQNDWNGSAKVALISLERSERAWRALAAAPGNGGAAVAVDAVARLRHGVGREFPDAMQFRRPGFDEVV